MTQPPGRVAATFRVNGVEVTVDVEPAARLQMSSGTACG